MTCYYIGLISSKFSKKHTYKKWQFVPQIHSFLSINLKNESDLKLLHTFDFRQVVTGLKF